MNDVSSLELGRYRYLESVSVFDIFVGIFSCRFGIGIAMSDVNLKMGPRDSGYAPFGGNLPQTICLQNFKCVASPVPKIWSPK